VTDQKLSLVTAGIPGAYEGKVVSASNYYPFGMDQPGRTWSAEGKYRFGYNTQEKVDEISGSGNHYTAQFWEYDPRIVRRWNRDPVTYPWQSPYAINNNNPIIFSDPLGLFGSRKEAREYRKEHNLKGRIRIDNEGYYSIDDKKAGTSIFKDAESGKIWTAALITAERSDHKNTTPFQLGVEWLTGKGPKSRDFTSGDQTVELYKQHDHYKNALSDVTGKLQSLSPNSPLPDYGYPYQLKGIEGVGKYVQDYSTLATGGQTGNLMFTYLGSHSLWIEVTANDVEKRIATVVFTVHNTSTLESGTRPPVIGYQEWYGNTIGNFLNTKVAGRTGATSETEQVFQWTQTIKY
jgi:RHS repeat-associated protein